MRGKPDTDREIAALAARQHGVVARRQLADLGLSKAAIDRRIAAGRLHRLHRGVFAVGHTVLKLEGRWMAATLATGGALSHGSAAAAWDLRRAGGGAIDVSVASRAGRDRRAGLRVHRSGTLTAADMTTHRGIPITTPARTIVDLARTLQGRPLEQLVDLADQRGLVDFDDLRSADPGSLKAVLQNYAPAATRSEMEERFLRLCDDHRIPRPETNRVIEGIEVDFVWRDRRLIVEVDGYAYHRSPGAFERDRERDVTLTTRGWRVLRFTWAKINRRADWVAASILAPWP